MQTKRMSFSKNISFDELYVEGKGMFHIFYPPEVQT